MQSSSEYNKWLILNYFLDNFSKSRDNIAQILFNFNCKLSGCAQTTG